VIGLYLKAGKIRTLAGIGALIVVIAVADWSVGNKVSLGVLYILPMMLGASVLNPLETAAAATLCAFLRARFDTPASRAEVMLRFVFALLAYYASGRFVTALIRNRELVVDHLKRVEQEQQLRREVEEQLKLLVDSSPAAILTLDKRGTVLVANNAANDLFTIPEGQTLQGRTITSYLPLLADALRLENTPRGFRTAAQCLGQRDNGEIFLAHTWFSSIVSPEGTRLAAIVVDTSEEMRDREEQNLRQLLKSNRIAAAAVSHEVRNLCGALSLLSSNLKDRHELGQDEDFQGLVNLIEGLEKIARLELSSRVHETLEEVPLQEVLDSLRIVVEPDWRELDGIIRWCFPQRLPVVLADPHGLLQAFLNLVQNSYRAVQESASRELRVIVTVGDHRAIIRFEDSGPGIASPERLFQPFHQGADGTGLGLYISRAVVRSFGGELRFEPQATGSCFVVELQLALGGTLAFG
jgi:two-component system, LuxR family, sensor kinase FixL